MLYTHLSEYKRDLKPINMPKLKENDLNKKNWVGTRRTNEF